MVEPLSPELSDREFDSIFITDKPVVFADHGYPGLIHRLTHRRTNQPEIRDWNWTH